MRLIYRYEGGIYVSVNYNFTTYSNTSEKITNEEYEKYKDLLWSEDTIVTKMILDIIKNERK